MDDNPMPVVSTLTFVFPALAKDLPVLSVGTTLTNFQAVG